MNRALLAGVCSLGVAGCAAGSSASSSSTPASLTAAAAQKLATFQPDAESAFEAVLSDLQPVCRESPDKVSGEIWASWKDLQKNNRPTSLLHVARALDTVGSGLTPNAEPTNCAALLAAYLVTAEAPGGQP